MSNIDFNEGRRIQIFININCGTLRTNQSEDGLHKCAGWYFDLLVQGTKTRREHIWKEYVYRWSALLGCGVFPTR